MLNELFVREIINNAKTEKFAVTDHDGDDIDVFSKPVHRLPLPEEPTPGTLAMASLEGIVDYMKSSDTDADLPNENIFIVQVVDFCQVRVVSSLIGLRLQRHVLAAATCDNLFNNGGFSFGRYYDIESFIPTLQSMFCGGDNDREKVLRMLSGLTSEVVRKDTDDGNTQIVAVRKGISMSEDQRVPNPVRLQPWRTFREVTQPTSPFVLRLKGDVGQPPTAALFEADGGAWKIDAVNSIKQWLADRLEDQLILG